MRNPPTAQVIQREKDNIRTRNGSLLFLAFGTAISSAMIGIELANHFHLPFWLEVIMIIFCVGFAYISVDSAVRNNLLASSDKSESPDLKNYFNKKAIVSLLFTVVFSVGAAYFIGQISKGQSPHEKFNATVNDFSKRDSTNKQLAATTLSQLTADQKNTIANIKKAAKAAEKDLVSDKSISWKSDYKAAKNNPKHWMWVCNDCPRKYKGWRDAIQKVRSESAQQIAAIQNTNTKIKTELAATLSYSIQGDTTLAKMGVYTNMMESERQNKAQLITLILILLTIAAALGAHGANNNLKRLREAHGQHVEDGDQIIFDVVEDFFTNILRQLLGVLFGMLIWIDKGLEKLGIDLYEINQKGIARFKEAAPDQVFEQVNNTSRTVVTGFVRTEPEQAETLGSQDLPTAKGLVEQPRTVARPNLGRTTEQPSRTTDHQPEQPKTIIKKETKVIVNNVNITSLKSKCKQAYLRSFYPSNDSQYKTRKNPPATSTMEDNKRRHLEKVEELAALGIKTKYVGEGKNRNVEFL